MVLSLFLYSDGTTCTNEADLQGSLKEMTMDTTHTFLEVFVYFSC